MIDEKLSVSANIGYISYAGKTITTPAQTILGITIPSTSIKIPAFGVTPVLIGGRYLFTENIYGQAQLGMSFYKGGSSFTYASGIGAKFGPIDATLKYVGWEKVGNIGLRVAYSF